MVKYVHSAVYNMRNFFNPEMSTAEWMAPLVVMQPLMLSVLQHTSKEGKVLLAMCHEGTERM
jgi:hypothetical protein